MSITVKSLKVTYNPVNEKNTFNSGDVVLGHVTLEVAKDCQIASLLIKFKGKAEVLWTERYGQTTVVYHAKDKYFSIKQYLIHDKDLTGDDTQTLLTNQNGQTWLCPPPLMAVLADLRSHPELMMPQHDSKDKKIKFFNSGTVAMDVNLEKTGFFKVRTHKVILTFVSLIPRVVLIFLVCFFAGEGLKVLASIQNNSSRQIKPKYCVYKKHSFFARGKRRVRTWDLFKEVGEPIAPFTKENVTRVLSVPFDLEPSILNCSIIKIEYRLRVYLDFKYASDPEIKFPIVILPASQVPAGVAPQMGASGFGFEPFGSTNPPAWGIVPLQPPAGTPQPSDPPPPYGAYVIPLMDFGNKY
ncbi:hypothetical protein EPR50_G00049620 [Perca flavescens]|uniref:Arrestin C-terminal-like domain-containing protein n=1 Tax=Perca flavescens TaxID=8167 RepID=A0A484DDP1_PERFV|nr:hypothetical protein EPR50_G00049620 [Perca flavescens]